MLMDYGLLNLNLLVQQCLLYNKRILGDAIGEIGPIYLKNHVTANDWYGNIAMFINSSSSWLQRGSAPFAFTPASQAGSYSQTFRIVLVK